jgi:hypothetical protein
VRRAGGDVEALAGAVQALLPADLHAQGAGAHLEGLGLRRVHVQRRHAAAGQVGDVDDEAFWRGLADGDVLVCCDVKCLHVEILAPEASP